MAAPVQNTQMVAEGLAHLTSTFRTKKVVSGLLKTNLLSVQDLMNTCWAVLYAKLITSNPPPSGVWLDKIGSIVGETRQGRSDAALYTAILLRILVNKSRGLAEDIIQISNAIAPSNYLEPAPLVWIVESYNVSASFDMQAYLRVMGQAKGTGVRGFVYSSNWPKVQNLCFSDGYGYPTSGYPAFSDGYGNPVSNAGLLVGAQQIVGVS